MSKRRALCVGINEFKNYPSSNLRGCVNDANQMAELLEKWVGFKDADIVKLTDEQATKQKILSNLQKMVEDAKAGKLGYLVFSMSSHGTQVPDRNHDEDDGADEAFCPHDLAQAGDAWDPAHVILDDELHGLFAQLPSNVLLEVYLDTCHSGDGLRGIDLLLDRRPRYLPPPSLDAFLKVRGKRSRDLHTKLLEKSLLHHVLWAACRADQTSADAEIGGAWHGAFTYFFCKEMNACKNALSRKQVLAKVRAELKAHHYTQVPQLEGEATVRTSVLR